MERLMQDRLPNKLSHLHHENQRVYLRIQHELSPTIGLVQAKSGMRAWLLIYSYRAILFELKLGV